MYHTDKPVVVEPLHRLLGHTARVNAVRVAPVGTTAVTASDDFTARVWDWKTGVCRLALAAFSPPQHETLVTNAVVVATRLPKST